MRNPHLTCESIEGVFLRKLSQRAEIPKGNNEHDNDAHKTSLVANAAAGAAESSESGELQPKPRRILRREALDSLNRPEAHLRFLENTGWDA
ncbi:hypothetical protein DdX_05583 [Ditylenchus destructor]|uniref:Uncharacterized protein n=1 Tax=Ditylenchus destructor TaxID=166010 RepID=A0AAD4R9Y4_9BILA|nr:hypothetical protein DdX_05583 [Ditylenchus destructor]